MTHTQSCIMQLTYLRTLIIYSSSELFVLTFIVFSEKNMFSSYDCKTKLFTYIQYILFIFILLITMEIVFIRKLVERRNYFTRLY